MRLHARSGLMALVLVALAFTGCKSGPRDHTDIPADAKVEETKPIVPGANVHVAAGDLAVGQGNADEAVRQYEKAIDMDPNSKIALYKLAALYTYERKFDIAIRTWQRYTDATNQSSNGYVNLGRANELAGNWKDAELSYLRAINREPQNRSARVNYGILLAKRDRIDEAEKQLASVLQPAEVQYNIASVYELRKNFPAATATYKKALQLDPKFTPAQQRLDQMNGVTAAN